VSERTDRIHRLRTAIGYCSTEVSRDDHLIGTLRLLGDGAAVGLVEMRRLQRDLKPKRSRAFYQDEAAEIEERSWS